MTRTLQTWLFAFLFLLTAAAGAQAQNNRSQPQSTPEASRYEYCEVHVTGSSNVYADFGYGREKLGGPELSKLEVGKLQVFATPISALNYLGSLGWELVQVYQPDRPTPTKTTAHDTDRYYVMRRLRSSTGVTVTKP
ncbi:hypothetical protein [Hymenobacter sp. CRA2]|uniref:hypothetical protein n=1 Tax=Hymenobacter sp. CRA2 TaxID=1955620 RepID=UPI00098EE44D|nr:hypothetical protein [Hymenobacter sp. CRA2]OON68501.1 hypothetical protein B0919_12710 [Hymenobacter sp. CRA2]